MWVGPAVLVAAIAALAISTAHWSTAYTRQVDMEIYRFAGSSLLHHRPLYDVGLLGRPGELLFNYPPFAALVFSVLAPFSVPVLRNLVPLLNIALLVFTVHRAVRCLGATDRRSAAGLTCLASGMALLIEPVRTTIALGQINLALLGLVVADLLPADRSGRWRGIGVGIAAGIKLTPLLFIPFLVLTQRVRAATIAAVSFAATVLVGFAVAPHDAATYWLHGAFDDLRRIAPMDSSGNESLRGLLARAGAPDLVAIAVVILAAAVCLLASAGLSQRGHDLRAVALCGLGTAAVSPFSWGYHWVWFALVLVELAHRAVAYRRVPAALGCFVATALLGAWVVGSRDPAGGQLPAIGLINLDDTWVRPVTENLYLILFGATLLWAWPRATGELGGTEGGVASTRSRISRLARTHPTVA